MAAAAVLGVVAPTWADSIPVAARALPVGTIVTEADLVQADVSSSKIYQGTPRTADEIIGKRLGRSLRASTPFNTFTLKAPNTIERNTAVTVLFKRPGIELSSQGVALESGLEGKTIRVLNPDSRTTVVATITGPGTVTIGDQ